MKRLFHRIAFVLGVAAVLGVQVHVGHADAGHLRSGDRECVVCHTLSSAEMGDGVAVAHFVPVEEIVVGLVSGFSSHLFCRHFSSRAPPAA